MGMSVLKKVDTFKTIYSNKTFDYMSCKIPVLMLIDGISKELVEQAKCGIFAEPENTDYIVNKVIEMMQYKDLSVLGENGYAYAKENFDRTKLASYYYKRLETIKEK